MVKDKIQKTIIGIDPGLADTGWGVIRVAAGANLSCLACGSLKTPAGQSLPARLEAIARGLLLIIKKYQPDLMAVEELFFCANVKTALAVGQARGVVVLTASQNRLPIFEYTPLQVKQAVSSYGRASKEQVGRMVKLILQLDEIPRPDDAADALAVAICAANV
ncbi:crossover junction endodeoxyribonuclease RuvC [Candidatus Falkowbacteria bacterium CG_4_10_14_0_2_um_filter_48_10]|uniref:Crossover junction endodeoxyribonuclease RuvC n=1 Tax=Candidatus Falkowbacteria bacterium CG23_combo_of_CG06-09_8_20_14_all_49_15 TaxID=1974572 RepID=A0A2G9ZLG1_9BACT|nr:MAG: crossover junction endodeoxyribonuclease RuvC [Candidatus Falkowbacteria bacterium CG23_combo_of_CG06-09_8_20_14_all_49_15]PJA08919.1 MAG: crossover junction endodeoxyribonuclease RuvC [Candidatus Falkowbacteria bacterium CG_4_10_14_0_2_um_filter_48_10]